jgi:hypothetical protein
MSEEPTDGQLRFDLQEAFRARQQQLEADLGFGRTVAGHPGTLGDASELDWTGMLSRFLPHRYGVSKAFVVDSRGYRSEQLDVVVHDRQYSPLLFEVGGAKFIPAESVYAVFEVKQHIDKTNIDYAAKKVASVRVLHRTSVGFPTATGRAPAREPHAILGGILALRASWTALEGPSLRSALEAHRGDGKLDLGCTLRDGAFEVQQDADAGSPDFCDDPTTALLYFNLRLMKRLQDIATVGAMDLDAYAAAVWHDG